jgi:hypothetical protein
MIAAGECGGLCAPLLPFRRAGGAPTARSARSLVSSRHRGYRAELSICPEISRQARGRVCRNSAARPTANPDACCKCWARIGVVAKRDGSAKNRDRRGASCALRGPRGSPGRGGIRPTDTHRRIISGLGHQARAELRDTRRQERPCWRHGGQPEPFHGLMSWQPCHATVVLSHAKLRPRGYGYFYNWQTVTFREFPGVSRLRWSFVAGEWVSRLSTGSAMVRNPAPSSRAAESAPPAYGDWA